MRGPLLASGLCKVWQLHPAAAALRETIEEVRGYRMLLAEGGLDQTLQTGPKHR